MPFNRYGQTILATNDGAMLQNAMRPLGVEAGTRSSAAERMMTYRTGDNNPGEYSKATHKM